MMSVYDIIRFPVVTEKSTLLAEQNKYVFKVQSTATKDHIRKAIETIFNVSVTAVNVVNVKGKVKRFRGRIGHRTGYKKAIISVAAGQTIDPTMGV